MGYYDIYLINSIVSYFNYPSNINIFYDYYIMLINYSLILI